MLTSWVFIKYNSMGTDLKCLYDISWYNYFFKQKMISNKNYFQRCKEASS